MQHYAGNGKGMMQDLSCRIPLVVGITGHRDLRQQDIRTLERLFAEILTRLQDDYQGTGDRVPIVLLSALAEGADRLAARVALSAGAKLAVALPMTSAEYKRDFETDESQNEYEQLLSQSLSTHVMGFAPGNTLDNIRTDPICRAKQYRAVGVFIVEQCDVLVALWDGNDKDRAMGGTAEVVAFKRDGIPLEISRAAGSRLDGSEI